MTLIDLILYLLVAGLAGAIGQSIVGYGRGGCLAAIAVGFIGAIIGTWLARQLGLPAWLTFTVGGTSFPFLWAIIGAALFVAVISLLSRGRL
ncbi:MAG: GlsB/YeaQ/YmgE family stress response membrane protein [Anaerolineae bacterium]|nr:MAG: GlsB/YeaQ/YmgE family stress response membrane protein [Anaerolineae bacterium]